MKESEATSQIISVAEEEDSAAPNWTGPFLVF